MENTNWPQLQLEGWAVEQHVVYIEESNGLPEGENKKQTNK